MVIPQSTTATIYANDPLRTFVGAAACDDVTTLEHYLSNGLVTDVNVAVYDGMSAVWSTIYDAHTDALVYLTSNRYQRVRPASIHASNGLGWTPISYTLHHACQLATDHRVLKALLAIDYRPFRDGERQRPRISDTLLERYGGPDPAPQNRVNNARYYERTVHPTKKYEWSDDEWVMSAFSVGRRMIDTIITPMLTRRLHQLQTLIATGGGDAGGDGMGMDVWKHANPLGQYTSVMLKPFADEKPWFVTAIIHGWLRYYTNDAITTGMCRLIVEYWPSPCQEPRPSKKKGKKQQSPSSEEEWWRDDDNDFDPYDGGISFHDD